MPDIQTGEAAKRLGTTTQTIGSLIKRKQLKARRLKVGKKRSVWLVDEASVDAYLLGRGRLDARASGPGSRLQRVESEIASLRRAFEKAGVQPRRQTDAVERERDDLRAEVSNLREALARSRDVAEIQREADAERSLVIEHLTAAMSANERADALRRRAAAALEDALAAALGPGHPGDLT